MALLPSLFLLSISSHPASVNCLTGVQYMLATRGACWLQGPDESSAPKLVKTTISILLCLSCVSFSALDYLQSGVTFHRKKALVAAGANSHLLSETVRKAESVTPPHQLAFQKISDPAAANSCTRLSAPQN